MGINGPIDTYITEFFLWISTFLHIPVGSIGVLFIIIALAALNDILTGEFRISIGGLGGGIFNIFTAQSDYIKNTFPIWTDLLIMIIFGFLGVRLVVLGFS